MAVSRSVALLLACCAVATTVLAVVELWQGRDAAQLALQRLQAQAAETDPASQRVRSVDLVDSPAADAVVGSLEPGGAVVKVAVTQLKIMSPVQAERRRVLQLTQDPLPIKPGSKGLYRLILSTIPRTGNGWMRGLIEGATEVATESVFPETGSKPSERSGAHSLPCGWLQDCSVVHPGKDCDPVIVKTHFPFVSQSNVTALLQANVSDVGEAAYLILPVRNPLDNFDAWMRYADERNIPTDRRTHTNLREFVDAWARHHNFWFSQPQPCFIYRYEDLVGHPVGILSQVLQSSGLWRYYNMTDMALLRVAGVERLQSYKRKQLGAQTRKKDDLAHSLTKFSTADISWVLEKYGDVLDRYGYRSLYETVLKAMQEQWPADELLAALKTIMSETASLANWGDAVLWPAR